MRHRQPVVPTIPNEFTPNALLAPVRAQKDLDKEAFCSYCEGEHSSRHNDILICDGCNKGFHLKCLDIDNVPHGDWFCCMRGCPHSHRGSVIGY